MGSYTNGYQYSGLDGISLCRDYFGSFMNAILNLKIPLAITSIRFNVRLSLKLQIKGKESENSYQELKRSQKDRHT